MVQRLDGMAWMFREMKEIIINISKKLAMMSKMQEEATVKKMACESASVM